MKYRTRYQEIEPYVTKDGSVVRELMHPDLHPNRAQSLAEATVFAGNCTLLHRHRRTEEIYYVTAGKGRMTLGERQFEILAGDCVCINPGVAHCVENTGAQPLVILCACTPPYAHTDTELLID